MKKNRKFPRIATVLLLAAATLGMALSVVPVMATESSTQEKIRLMSAALRARDSGDLYEAKTNLEELIKIAPSDQTVARLLDAVNKDIERQGVGQATVYGGAPEIVTFEPETAEEVFQSDTTTSWEPAPVVYSTEPAPVVYSNEPAPVIYSNDSVDLDTFLDSAAIEQEQQIGAAKIALADAKQLSKAERYDEAINMLVAAKSRMSYNQATDSIIADIDNAIGAYELAKVKKVLTVRDFETAESITTNYRNQGGNQNMVTAMENTIEAVRNDPWNQDVNELSPGFLEKQETIDKLLVKGRAQLLYGDLSGAQQTISEIEARDPFHAGAKSLQMKIAELRGAASKMDRYKTRQQMIQEVERSWQRPQVFDLEAPKEEGGPTGGIIEKLRNIQVPEFRVSGSPLTRVLDTLSGLSQDLDPNGLGVNMVKPDGEDPLVTIRLRNLNMEQVLNFVAKQVGFTWEPQDGVVVFEKTGQDIFLETEFFPISTATVIRLTGFSDNSSSNVAQSDPFATVPAASASSGPSATEREEALKNFFERAGISFEPPATLAFDGTQLIVTQTPKKLERMNVILRRYNQPKQVEIETKFLEVQQGALEELGFQWSANQGTNARNTRTFDSSSTARSLSGAFSIDADSSSIEIKSPDVRLFNDQGVVIAEQPGLDEDVPFLPPSIPSQIDLAETATSLITNMGVINGNEVNLIINALSRKEGSDLMSSPRVTVLSGRTAQIVVAQELRYPENYSDIEAEVDSGDSSEGAAGASVAITAGTPQDFTVRNVGVEMEVTPTVEENENISLKLEPRVTEFEGFVEYGGPSVAIAGGVTVTVPSGFFQPVFGVRSVRTEVTIYDGATVVIGGLTREEVKSVEDKVPVLGDIPLIGRLFRSEGETSLKRNLLIFVTANLISPGGSPTNQNLQGARANSQFQNPIVVLPSGGVSREVSE